MDNRFTLVTCDFTTLSQTNRRILPQNQNGAKIIVWHQKVFGTKNFVGALKSGVGKSARKLRAHWLKGSKQQQQQHQQMLYIPQIVCTYKNFGVETSALYHGMVIPYSLS